MSWHHVLATRNTEGKMILSIDGVVCEKPEGALDVWDVEVFKEELSFSFGDNCSYNDNDKTVTFWCSDKLMIYNYAKSFFN